MCIVLFLATTMKKKLANRTNHLDDLTGTGTKKNPLKGPSASSVTTSYSSNAATITSTAFRFSLTE